MNAGVIVTEVLTGLMAVYFLLVGASSPIDSTKRINQVTGCVLMAMLIVALKIL